MSSAPKIQVKYSPRYRAVQRRLKQLPKLSTEVMDVRSKRLAIELIKTFQEGIRKRTFRLRPLGQMTIQRKREMGQPKPATPLYGEGDREDNSYINLLGIRKLKKGYRVVPRRAKEHDSDIMLKDLFQVHEFGATIQVTDRMRKYLHAIGIHLSREKTVIRIPPRPAFFMANRRVLIRERRRDPAPEVRKALTRFINTGKTDLLDKIRKKTPDWDDFDETLG